MFRNDLDPWNRWPNILILRLYCFIKKMERVRQKNITEFKFQIECQSWMCGMHSLIFILFRKLSFAMCLFRGPRKKLDELWVAKRHLFPLWLSVHSKKQNFFRHLTISNAFQLLFRIHSIYYVQVPWHQPTKKPIN